MAARTAPPPPRLPYLDGLRCLAVSMVLAYHGGLPGLSVAGFYGVDVFFVLSGYLITSLLLREYDRRWRIGLVGFWGRRARRLLPALLLMLAGVDLYVALGPPGAYPGFRADAYSALGYVSNWHLIAASSNYFASAAAPSLLTHTWSLAIEEQFYLVWPLALWAAAAAGRRWGLRPATAVLVLSGGGAVASAAWMAVLYGRGASPSRLYYGTDTHASSLLVGAALAALAVRGRAVAGSPAGDPTVGRTGPFYTGPFYTGAAAASAAGLLWVACRMGSSDPLAYRGGFLAVAVASAILLTALLRHPAGPAARVLSVAPVRYIGRISYGMYLWYFPLFAVLDRSRTGQTGPALFAVRVAADVAVAAASHHLVERRLLRPARDRAPGRARTAARSALLVGAVGTAAALVALTAAPGPGIADASVGPGPLAAPPAAGAPAAPATGRPPLRLLVTGDSTAMTLGLALDSAQATGRYGLVVDDAALMGCGVAISASVREHGVATTPPVACDTASPPARQWPALLQQEMARFRPDVVLVAAGRWEVESRRTAAGHWTDITDAADREYVRAQLELAESIARRGGARVALATAPCFSSGEQADGSGWPEDAPGRLRAYNDTVESLAAASPPATVVDLNALLCPGGRFHTTIGGVTVRAPDGVHYPFFSLSAPDSPAPDTEAQTDRFGEWIAARILPSLAG